MARRVLISAGEASGDLYAAGLVEALRRRNPDLDFFGCAGPRMQQAGVRAVVDSRSLSVVGLVEVITHIPRIYGEYRKLLNAARSERPEDESNEDDYRTDSDYDLAERDPIGHCRRAGGRSCHGNGDNLHL